MLLCNSAGQIQALQPSQCRYRQQQGESGRLRAKPDGGFAAGFRFGEKKGDGHPPSLRRWHLHRMIGDVKKINHRKPIAVFDSPTAAADWYAVNDNVMGGRSSGGPRYDDGELVFSGRINTDGGGFSSIRAPLPPAALAGMSGLELRVRPDARVYQLTLRTDVKARGMSVAFRGEIDAPQAGEWADCRIEFEDLVPTVFGRPVEGAVFDPANASSIGIIISDGKDGPFELAIASIHACVD